VSCTWLALEGASRTYKVLRFHCIIQPTDGKDKKDSCGIYTASKRTTKTYSCTGAFLLLTLFFSTAGLAGGAYSECSGARQTAVVSVGDVTEHRARTDSALQHFCTLIGYVCIRARPSSHRRTDGQTTDRQARTARAPCSRSVGLAERTIDCLRSLRNYCTHYTRTDRRSNSTELAPWSSRLPFSSLV